MRQVGSMEIILQKTTGLFNVEYVITGTTTAAGGQIIFISVTVATSTFTGLEGHLRVDCVTVPMDYQVNSRHFLYIDLQLKQT